MSVACVFRPLPFAAVSASSTAAGHDPAFVGTDFMGVVWKSAPGASASVTVDLGSDVVVDAAALLGCTGAGAGWTLTVECMTSAAPGSVAWSSGSMPFLAGTVFPSSGRGRAVWLAPSSGGPGAARYWRFTVAGLSGGESVVIGRIALGRRIALARNFSFGAVFGVRDLGSLDWSVRGVLLRRRAARLRSVGLTFASVRRDEVEAGVQPLIEAVGTSDPIVLITDPDAHAQRQNRIFFGPLTGDLGTIWTRAAGFEWQANVIDLEPVPAP